ncbi:activator of HSP90 ATPase 1 family protein [Rhizobium freirei PRF 81]|uniref:Activator of HSP90 ATPase 1 family protein n=1 Tax=Rhizobium freirei PRF 81 TaxID=363754 RepID=N6V2D2_9HYPH|nr:SRPBCC domain-containing protein [Rhizobium freirei]ENN88005.1 activator of HSP90 ATPase 1 family protein [Rhizobium freirei PRF 81]
MTERSQRHELSFTRIIDAPRDEIFRCWTEEELLKQWFAPLPWTVSAAKIDIRAGGKTRYTATVLHWSAEDREAHEKMGFRQGWAQCAEQLAALTAKI